MHIQLHWHKNESRSFLFEFCCYSCISSVSQYGFCLTNRSHGRTALNKCAIKSGMLLSQSQLGISLVFFYFHQEWLAMWDASCHCEIMLMKSLRWLMMTVYLVSVWQFSSVCSFMFSFFVAAETSLFCY